MINKETYLPLRIYTGTNLIDIKKRQYANRRQANGKQLYKVVSPMNNILPFQFSMGYIDEKSLSIVSWTLYNEKGAFIKSLPIQSISAYKSELNKVFFIWKSEDASLGLNLSGGHYYFTIRFSDSQIAVSEIFFVDCENSVDRFLKVEFWNSCDFIDVLYKTGYKNRIYLDGALLKNAPTVEETGNENGLGEFITTSVKMFDNYKLQVYVPEFIYQSIVFAMMNDNVWLTHPDTKESGLFKIKKISESWDDYGYMVELNVELTQERLIYRSGCCENIDAINQPITEVQLYSDEYSEEYK